MGFKLIIAIFILIALISIKPDTLFNPFYKNSFPIPTPSQLQYQQHEISALIHYDMATYAKNGDPGCNAENWDIKMPYAAGKTNDPATFNPQKLNTDQWAQVMLDLGAKHAVLTAKHGCGFLLWPTKVKLPKDAEYDYCVNKSRSALKVDLLGEFVKSMDKFGIGHGFYYSLTNNFYLNVNTHQVQNTTLLPGQVKVTQSEFESIALQQIQELWTNYGNLTEIWFDGGYTSDMQKNITTLISTLQDSAACFGGYGVSKNPVCWVGTESGHPNGDIWSTGLDDKGDPNSPIFCPKGCDTTLQVSDIWFWEKDVPIRSLSELISVYHDTVGRNGMMELAFHIDRDGLVPNDHAQRYKELGDWVKACYGKSIVEADGQHTTQIVVKIPDNATFDRVMIQENLAQGQNIRKFTVDVKFDKQDWTQIAAGTSVGNKRIFILDKLYKFALFVRLTVTEYTQTPYIQKFGVYAQCSK